MGERYDNTRSYRVSEKPEGIRNGGFDAQGNKVVVDIVSPDGDISYIVYEPIARKSGEVVRPDAVDNVTA